MRNRRKKRGSSLKFAIALFIISVILFAVFLVLKFPPLVMAIFAAYLVAAGGSLIYFGFLRGKDDDE
ncbi:MAG: hypothetical protein II583_06160 [Oscillospiraceae bacterium]|nr:hypothetical protein [Oscillospiraceae bacterium]